MNPAQLWVYGGSTQTDIWILSLGSSPSWTPQAPIGPDLAPDGHARLAAGFGPPSLWIYGGRSMGAWELDIPYGLAVEPPSVSRIRLLLSNPARGRLVVSFELPDRSPARIDLFDLAGRRVDQREIGSLGAGIHQVELGGTRLRSGLYVVHLAQGTRSSTAKVVVAP
jgi:hypothetical protein